LSRVAALRDILTKLNVDVKLASQALDRAHVLAMGIAADMGFESRDGSRLNRGGYQKLITENIAWLEAQPPTLERTHIKQVLLWSVNALYGRLEPRCREDGYKDGKCVNLAEDGFCRLSDCTHSLVKPPTDPIAIEPQALPCTMCGITPNVFLYYDRWVVECASDCGCERPSVSIPGVSLASKAEAIALWNISETPRALQAGPKRQPALGDPVELRDELTGLWEPVTVKTVRDPLFTVTCSHGIPYGLSFAGEGDTWRWPAAAYKRTP
jgi:hypothetical protein